jgi:chromosome segregation ATPase
VALAHVERVATRSPDFRRQRLAREAIDKIQDKADTEAEMAAMKSEVDQLKETNQDLLQRIEQLEQRSGQSGAGDGP